MEIYGDSLQEKGYRFLTGLPNYVRYGYEPHMLSWSGQECVVLTPKDSGWRIPTLKKHLTVIREKVRLPVVFELDRLTALQRRNLISSGIAFISGQGQIFLPFWGSYFEEKIQNPPAKTDTLTATAQLVFLHLFYQSLSKPVHVTFSQVCDGLFLPKATTSRAVQLLHSLGLVTLTEERTAKIISFPEAPKDVLRKALTHMVSPVQKTLYFQKLPPGSRFLLCGMRALSSKSMLDASPSDIGFAACKEEMKKIPADAQIGERDYRDLGGLPVELWRYDPRLLSSQDNVDDISLYLSLRDQEDDRVQRALDELLSVYG
ncbi:MAG: MarR family transcriptional regulator [Lachnospiraceae bacterium]|nr:MarR family transcriptional regulator [Lachnospiraceae bacterium]